MGKSTLITCICDLNHLYLGDHDGDDHGDYLGDDDDDHDGDDNGGDYLGEEGHAEDCLLVRFKLLGHLFLKSIYQD